MRNSLASLLISGVLLCAAGIAQGQVLSKGATLALNGTTLYGDDTAGIDAKNGFAIGAFLEYGVNDKFSVQPEVLFTQKGFQTTFLGITITTNLNYLEIPLLAQYKVTPAFHVFSGLAAEIYLNGKIEADGGSESEDVSSDDVNSVGFGIPVGAGYAFGSGFQLDARLIIGLNNALKDSDSDINAKHMAFQILLGWAFN